MCLELYLDICKVEKLKFDFSEIWPSSTWPVFIITTTHITAELLYNHASLNNHYANVTLSRAILLTWENSHGYISAQLT